MRNPAYDVRLAILDVVMPRWSGQEVFGAMRARGQSLPVVFVTGYDYESLTAAVNQPGIALLHKPFSGEVSQKVALKQDSVTFKLGPFEGMEYKYRMEKGASMVYSWTSTGRVRFDFHGEPQGAPKDYAESYEMAEGQKASGSFFAPTSGIHGWFWENLSTDEITITLTSTGFYASGIEFSADGQKPHDLRPR